MSRDPGKVLEEALQYQHNLYRGAGLAEIWHERTAGKFLPGGKFVPDPDKSRPDFMGAFAPFGRAIAFDAKSVAGDRWLLKPTRLHQLEKLAELDRLGAIAFFLVESRARSELALLRIRFENLSDQLNADRPCVSFKLPYAEAELLRIPIFPGYPPDWLPAVLDSPTFASSYYKPPRAT